MIDRTSQGRCAPPPPTTQGSRKRSPRNQAQTTFILIHKRKYPINLSNNPINTRRSTTLLVTTAANETIIQELDASSYTIQVTALSEAP